MGRRRMTLLIGGLGAAAVAAMAFGLWLLGSMGNGRDEG